MALGLEEGRVVCYDRAGRRIPDHVQTVQRLNEAEAARAAGEARALQMEAERRRLGGEG